MLRRSAQTRVASLMLGLCALVVALQAGCSQERYYHQADEEAKRLVAEKSNDPRWTAPPDFNIQMDPRSRFYDSCNQIRPPMPEDDPAAHVYMHCVDGKKGYKKWLVNGQRCELENPCWRQRLGEYAEVTPEGRVKLTLESAMAIARINSPEFQEQLEQVYLSALDVSTERFRFDVQFFGHNETAMNHDGRLHAGGELNTLRTDTKLEMNRQFATAGELLVGFANSFVWQFAGPDQYSTFSILDFSLVQPLLRGAGRAVALEYLTITERSLLASLRSLQRYRQGFYTSVSIGDLGVGGVSRRGGFMGGTGLTGFTGTGTGGYGALGSIYAGGGVSGFAGGGAGSVGGLVGLLQQLQRMRNTEENLNAQLRALSLLEAHLEAGTVDLTQVDQFRQSIETSRAELLVARDNLESQLDSYKTGVLGLPPNLPVELDDTLIHPFQFISPDMIGLQNRLSDFLDQFGLQPPEPDKAAFDQAFEQLTQLCPQVQQQFDVVTQDLQKARETMPVREQAMSPVERRLLGRDLDRLSGSMQELRQQWAQLQPWVGRLRQQAETPPRRRTADQLVAVVAGTSTLVGELSLVQARARLEQLTIRHETLDPEVALSIARANRLDWMNQRASLVDTWRWITLKANDLESDLGVTLSGDISTTGNNPVRFRAPTGSLRAGLQFDPPFTRLLERNNFRQVLIDYQRDRRNMIQYEDGVHQNLRQLLRQLDELSVNLEIQRRAVAIAIRRVDKTRETINQPPPPAQPGQAQAQLGPTAAFDLLNALTALRGSQDAFMSVWMNYYAARMRLARELGIMELDSRGMWVERPLAEAERASPVEASLPPPVPQQWLQELEKPAPTGPRQGETASPASAPLPLDRPASDRPGFPSVSAPEVPARKSLSAEGPKTASLWLE